MLELSVEGKVSQNKALQKELDTIRKLTVASQQNLGKIAFRLAKIDAMRYYESEGFKNTAELVRNYLGYSKQTTSTLIRVGSRFLNEDGTSNLQVEGEGFSVYQLQEMLPLDADEINCYLGGEITPGMGAKKIREAVKKIHEPEGIPKQEAEPGEKPEEPKKYIGFNTLANCMASLLHLCDENPLQSEEVRKAAEEINLAAIEILKKYGWMPENKED